MENVPYHGLPSYNTVVYHKKPYILIFVLKLTSALLIPLSAKQTIDTAHKCIFKVLSMCIIKKTVRWKIVTFALDHDAKLSLYNKSLSL